MQMNFTVDNIEYQITQDKYCYTLSHKMVVEEGKPNAGRIYYRDIGHFANLFQVAKRLIDLGVEKEGVIEDISSVTHKVAEKLVRAWG